jgi:hypothetical protein
VIVSDIQSAPTDEGFELSARVTLERDAGEDQRVWFRFADPEAPIPAVGDPFLVGLVIPCMMLGEDLTIDGPVSPELVAAVEAKTIPIVLGWRPAFERAAIRCADSYEHREADAARGVGSCFSGGVDSHYSLEKNVDRITHLITIAGFDRALDAPIPWQNTLDRARAISRELEKSLLVVSTNLGSFGGVRCLAAAKRLGRKPRNFYLGVYHGSVLVAVGVGLQGVLRRLIVPSSNPHGHMIPWGSHPELDASWSTRALAIDHDGAEADRVEKVKWLAQRRPECIRTLAVCHDADRQTPQNCGRCEKCLRILMVLRAWGLSHLAESFAEPLDLGRVELIEIPEGVEVTYEKARCMAEAADDRALVAALDAVFGRRFSWRRTLDRAQRPWRKMRRRGRSRSR